MKLTEDEKLLYDSCGEYVMITIFKKMAPSECNTSGLTWCEGDNNILELCNRCPYYTLLTDHSVDPIAK